VTTERPMCIRQPHAEAPFWAVVVCDLARVSPLRLFIEASSSSIDEDGYVCALCGDTAMAGAFGAAVLGSGRLRQDFKTCRSPGPRRISGWCLPPGCRERNWPTTTAEGGCC